MQANTELVQYYHKKENLLKDKTAEWVILSCKINFSRFGIITDNWPQFAAGKFTHLKKRTYYHQLNNLLAEKQYVCYHITTKTLQCQQRHCRSS